MIVASTGYKDIDDIKSNIYIYYPATFNSSPLKVTFLKGFP